MRPICRFALLLCLFQVYAFAAPAPKPKPKDNGPRVIDYSPLVSCSNFSVYLTVRKLPGAQAMFPSETVLVRRVLDDVGRPW